MTKMASYLIAARSALRMDLKMVASINGISDKTLTRIEQTADQSDPNAELLMSFYRRHGIEFTMKGTEIDSMRISDSAREGMIVFDSKLLDERLFYSLPGFFRHVVQLVLKPNKMNKRTGSIGDSYKFSVPNDSEEIFCELLTEWVKTNGSLTLINSHGESLTCDTDTNARDIALFIDG